LLGKVPSHFYIRFLKNLCFKLIELCEMKN
jgi:hypothetical protein